MIAIAVVFAVIAAVVVPTNEREPLYKDRKLSQWVLQSFHHQGENRIDGNNPAPALNAMGTNAVPWLLKWFEYEEPAIQMFWREYHIPIMRTMAERNLLLEAATFDLFQNMGTNTSPAIPFITHRLQQLPPGYLGRQQTMRGYAAERLAFLLLFMGPPGVRALADCVTNTNIAVQNRILLINLAEQRYWDPTEPNRSYVHDALTNCLNDPSPEIRKKAQGSFQSTQGAR